MASESSAAAGSVLVADVIDFHGDIYSELELEVATFRVSRNDLYVCVMLHSAQP